jgi:very-short-patch-repair endonuclease
MKRNGNPEIVGKVNPYSMENLQKYIKSRGSDTIVVDKEYKNIHHKINLICGSCGKPYQDSYTHIKFKSHIYCQQCGVERRASTHRHDVEVVKKELEKLGYKLLNENFTVIGSLEVEDKDGYRSSCASLYFLSQGKSFIRNHKQNLYTPYNIDLYLQKQGINTRVADLTPRHIEVKNDKIGFICSCCGNVFNATFDQVKHNGRVLCQDCSKTMSNLEYKVKTYLDENNIEYIQQKRFNDCRKKRALPFDFYLPKYNYVIEVNGQQHYYENKEYFHLERTLQQQQEFDNFKKDYCIKKGIGYLELPFWLINNPPQTYKKKIDEIIGKS